MKRKNYLLFIYFLIPLLLVGKEYSLKSPDGKLEILITADNRLSYALMHTDGRTLLEKSQISLILEDKIVGENPKIIRHKKRHESEDIVSPFYRVPSFRIAYNELDLSLQGGFGVVFRAYNEGMAYQFYTSVKTPLIIKDEIAEFNFGKDHPVYIAYSTAKKGEDPYAMAFQNLYASTKMSEIDTSNAGFLPITVDYGSELKLTILESDLESYPGMFIRKGDSGFALRGEFAPYPARMEYRPWRHMTYVAERESYIAQTKSERSFPWRILAVTEKDTDMPVNNLVYALASPNRIGDYSWVKTGKVAWEWWNNWGITGVDFKAGINTDTYKHYIDFASENGMPFVILDEGWYDPKAGNMMQVIAGLDLKEIIRYGKSKQVDVILWVVFNVLDEYLEEACQTYSQMGVSGFKVDFLDRDDQTAVEMVYRLAETAAKYKLSLNLHGMYKPTGLNRTFPNIVNFESVFGMEEVKWSTVEKDMMRYDVIMPYIRLMAGPVDYTPGAMRNATKADFKDIYNNPMSQGTRCHQLATYIIHDAPMIMLADNPTIYRKEQECTDFIVNIPNTGIEETRVLDGKLGEYIITACRVGDNWYVGGLTNWDAREIMLDLSFLSDGEYEAVLFRDGINADKNACDYKKEIRSARKGMKWPVKLAPGGGFAVSFHKK